MMAVAHPKLALRPFLPADAPLLREIFRDSIEELTSDDYTESQQEAWASAADDVRSFGDKLAGQLTLVATLEGSLVGFASLEGKDKIDMPTEPPPKISRISFLARMAPKASAASTKAGSVPGPEPQ